jgi:hypothetical protein
VALDAFSFLHHYGVRDDSKMTYIRVRWVHSFPDTPVLLYSELDDQRWEVRKVEVYGDGRKGFAGPNESAGDTMLGKEPIPPVTEISSDPQFDPSEISKHEFETVWVARNHSELIS